MVDICVNFILEEFALQRGRQRSWKETVSSENTKRHQPVMLW